MKRSICLSVILAGLIAQRPSTGAPTITVQPDNVYTDPDELVLFTLDAEPTSGELTYQWHFDGVAIADDAIYSGAATSRLVVGTAGPAQAGDYFVRVSDDSGSMDSSVVGLSLSLALPAIDSEPADLTVNSGDSAVFSATVTDAVTLQWYFNGTPLADGAGVSGSTTDTLSLSGVTQNDNGLYQLRIANARGATRSREARLRVAESSVLGGAIDTSLLVVANPGGWTTQSEYTSDGVDAATHPTIDHSQSSAFSLQFVGPGTFEYDWWVSSEGADPLRARLDGYQYTTISGTANSWATRSLAIVQGTHVHEWEYAKDHSIDTGLDHGFVDLVSFEPYVLASVPAAVDQEAMEFRYGGDGTWFGETEQSHDGVDAARAPGIGHSEAAWFETTVRGPGVLSYWAMTSSEGPDKLDVSIDGSWLASRSGTGGTWEQISHPIPWGLHEVRWTWSKDHSINSGDDTVWVDEIRYTPVHLSPLDMAADDSVMQWSTSPTHPWFGQDTVHQDSVDALQSGVTGHSEESWVRATTQGPGILEFSWRTSSEGPDRLYFAVNGVDQDSISGENDWTTFRHTVLRDEPTEFTWRYQKDHNTTVGADAAWIDQVSFIPAVTPTLEDAADDGLMTWATDPAASWFGQVFETNDGEDALRSADIGNSGESWIEAVTEGPGTISFFWKADCESSDRLYFFIDGANRGSVAGSTEWVQETFDITAAGPVTLRWSYQKDGSISAGEDAVWLDQVVFTPQRDPVTLTVAASPHGNPVPPVGDHVHDWNTTLNLSAPTVDAGDTRHVAIGWTGTGSVPASGVGNSVNVTLIEDSSISWIWQTQFELSVSVIGQGSSSVTGGFYPASQLQTLTAIPDEGWLFMGWSGDAESNQEEIEVTLDTPLSLTVTFSDDADGDGLTNTEEENIGSSPWLVDTDDDKFDDALEVAHGWNPTVSDSWAVDHIKANPDDFGLQGGAVDLSIADLSYEFNGDTVEIALQFQQSDDLEEWVPAGDPVLWQLPLVGDRQFLRLFLTPPQPSPPED